MSQTQAAPATHEHEHDHAHPPHLAHHFETPRQQYDSGKLGMWIFLATEILMFGGLFCAYAVYRANHPEIYAYAHRYLDTGLGALNTAILIASSFTMAWAVRASQLGQKTLLVTLLALTLGGGFGFMIIKTIEYNAKFSHDLGPGYSNVFYPAAMNPHFADAEDPAAAQLAKIHHVEEDYGIGAGGHGEEAHGEDAHAPEHTAVGEQHAEPQPGPDPAHALPATAAQETVTSPEADDADPAPPAVEQSVIAAAPAGPTGVAEWVVEEGDAAHAPGHHGWTYEALPDPEQARVHTFFQIYFLMTGLHGLHVLVGMGLIAYVLVRAARGAFGPSYFTPVDIIGLYWHLVDLIWIFLFPLLYLIH